MSQEATEDTVTVFVKAAQSRKRNGGIWRSGFFFTMQYHEVEVTESQLESMENDPNLVVSHNVEEDVASDTMRAANQFPNVRTMAQSLLQSDGDDDDGEEEEDDEEEKGNSSIEQLLEKSSKKKPASKTVQPNGSRAKVKSKSGKTSDSDEISASKPQGQTEDELEDDTPALRSADDPLDPRTEDDDDPTL